jgi:polar amino acid transport system permease protein
MHLQALAEMFDFPLLWEYRRGLLRGLAMNFEVFAAAAAVAISVGLLVAMLRLRPGRLSRMLGTGYVEIFRNAPEYVLLTWVHFVLPLLITYLLRTQVNFKPFTSAVLALGLAYGGYFAEAFRGGIQAIPRAHVEAARALGMSGALTLRRIVLPQAIRLMLPEGMNLLVSLFKATTLVSLIAVPDLLYEVTIIVQAEMRPMPLYSGAAFIYFAVILVISALVNRLTERWRTTGR